VIRGLLLPGGLLLAAELAAWAGDLRSDSLARPSDIALALAAGLLDGSFLHLTAQTLAGALAGLTLGGGIGLLLGTVLGLAPVLARLADVSIETMRPIPSVALVPVALLVFGFGYPMEISVVAFATCWPMLIYTRSAIQAVEPRLLEVTRVLALRRAAAIWKVVLPAALPRVLTALRIALAIALIIAVTVEVTANPQGIGHAMMTAQQTLQPATMFALLVWLGLTGLGLNLLLGTAQRRWLGPAARAGVVR
jgi:NitT/TauT family transport system permease protein